MKRKILGYLGILLILILSLMGLIESTAISSKGGSLPPAPLTFPGLPRQKILEFGGVIVAPNDASAFFAQGLRVQQMARAAEAEGKGRHPRAVMIVAPVHEPSSPAIAGRPV